MDKTDRNNLETQLTIKKRALQILEEQATTFTDLYVPPYIKIQIEGIRLEITEIEDRLGTERSYGPRHPGTLPPGWNIPHPRNPNFSGRTTELATLKTALESGLTAAVTQAISGLGGVGKTQLAVEYAYRQAPNFSLVWWVRAEQETSLRLDLEQLALTLGLIEPTTDSQVAINAALDFLQSKAGRWLLIFDNANNPTEIRDYLPKGGRGQILVTSRWQDWRGYAKPLPVPVWDKTQAVTFLLQRTGQTDTPAAEKLAEKLGYLPLALEHAGAYLSHNTILTFADYLHEFEQQKLALLVEGHLATDHHHDTIRTTWQISLQQLPPAAAALLNLCAYLAPDNIPLSLFLNNPKKLPETIATAAASKSSFAKTIATLQQYSLVELSQDHTAFSLHRLLQMVIRERNHEPAATPPPIVGTGLVPVHDGGLGLATRLLNAASPQEITDYRTWAEYAPLLPHALAVAEEAEKLQIEPQATGYVLNQAGLYLKGRADYKTALNLYQRAITIGEKTLEAEEPELATSYNNLGRLLQDMGDLPTARIYLDKALAIWEKALGLEHTQVALGYNNLGNLLQAMGDLPTARVYLEKALAISEKALGSNHPTVAIRYNNLGGLLQDMGDLPTARIYLDKALAIGEKTLGTDHPDVATRYNNLGMLLQAIGDLPTARTYLERALKIFQEKLGENHPNTQIVRDNLAALP